MELVLAEQVPQELTTMEGFQLIESSIMVCAMNPFPRHPILKVWQQDRTTQWLSVFPVT
jgi:hypothetical protein